MVYSLYAPRMTVFDFQEKKFFCCKHFSPEKAEKKNTGVMVGIAVAGVVLLAAIIGIILVLTGRNSSPQEPASLNMKSIHSSSNGNNSSVLRRQEASIKRISLSGSPLILR